MTTSSRSSHGPDRHRQILESFSGNIRPVRESWVYRIGLVVVALAMILLPLIYTAVIAAVSYAVYYHGSNNFTLFETTGSTRGAVLAYFGPLVVGIVMVLFMVKPIFARKPKASEPRSLDRDQEPLLFEFVDRVCVAVGAPQPKRIDIDSGVNAYASFRRGWLSLFGNDLVLTLGLPLIAGLSLQQFAGILAHEFGHFSQRVGMRLTYIIRTVNHWFLRVVYERDGWDESLDKVAQRGGFWIIIGIAHLSRFFVWLTRKLLWALMSVGNLISCFMLRQMEYDADRHEARLVGATTFESTCRELQRLVVAYQFSLNDVDTFWQDRYLVDNLPELMMARRARLPEELLQVIDQEVDSQKTGFLATHPGDADRIKSAWREGDEAIFRSELPATAVFQDFEELARESSVGFFRTVFGDDVTDESLRPVSSFLERQEKSHRAYQALRILLQGQPAQSRPLPLPSELPPAAEEPAAARERLEEIRSQLLAGRDKRARLIEEWSEQQVRLMEDAKILDLRAAKVKVSAKEVGRDSVAASAILVDQAEATRRLEEIGGGLTTGEELAVERLMVASSLLLRSPELKQRHDNAAELLRTAAALEKTLIALPGLREDHFVLGALLKQFAAKQTEPLAQVLLERSRNACERLASFRSSIDGLRYPFEHASREATVAEVCLPAQPVAEEVANVYQLLEVALERTLELRGRLLGHLAVMGLEIEHALGLEPLPDLPSPEFFPADED